MYGKEYHSDMRFKLGRNLHMLLNITACLSNGVLMLTPPKIEEEPAEEKRVDTSLSLKYFRG
jgi:HSP20 family molecular chaperone IbpA